MRDKAAAADKWKSVRPWLPPQPSTSTSSASASASSSTSPIPASPVSTPPNNMLHLTVLDVLPTSLALSVHTDPNSLFVTKPLVSISLDGKPWPHVEENGEDNEGSGGGTTVLVYGLEEGRSYQVGLEVIAPGDEVEYERAGDSLARDVRREDPVDRAHQNHNSFDDSILVSAGEEPPPPPYTPTPPPTINSLRAHLKSLRLSTRRTESSLQSSLLALKKAVEKGLKEDQRARTRIVSLEEAIRKAEEAERDASEGGAEWERVQQEYERELEREAEWTRKLEELAAGEKDKDKGDKDKEDDENSAQLAELSRELDAINKSIEEASKLRDSLLKDQLHSLEMELAMVDDAIMTLASAPSIIPQQQQQLPQHFPSSSSSYSLSSDSLPLPLQLQHPHSISPSLPLPLIIPPLQPQSSSSFGLKWRRAPSSSSVINNDPSSGSSGPAFTRFFRRGVSDPNVTLPLSLEIAPPTGPPGFSYQFAKDRQNLWASGLSFNNSDSMSHGMTRLEPTTSRSSLEVPSFSNTGGGVLALGGRRRSGSLGSGFSATSSSSRSSLDQPFSYNGQLQSQHQLKEESSSVGSGSGSKSWLPNWSQVVRKDSNGVAKEKPKDRKRKGREQQKDKIRSTLGLVEDEGEVAGEGPEEA